MFKISLTLLTLAHSWYDPWCCNNKDCHPISGVTEKTDGYHWNGFVIPYNDTSIRESQDGQFHICVYNGVRRCFYRPPRGF